MDGTARHVAEFENRSVSYPVVVALTLLTARNDSGIQQDAQVLRDVRLRGLGTWHQLGDALLSLREGVQEHETHRFGKDLEQRGFNLH